MADQKIQKLKAAERAADSARVRAVQVHFGPGAEARAEAAVDLGYVDDAGVFVAVRSIVSPIDLGQRILDAIEAAAIKGL